MSINTTKANYPHIVTTKTSTFNETYIKVEHLGDQNLKEGRTSGYCQVVEPKMTNREWLMSLSDRDLSKRINNYCSMCSFVDDNRCCIDGCTYGIQEWLNAEHIDY